MTDSQMDAPERIWAWYWNGKTYSGQWHVAPTSILDANLYILATPTVLAADPAVKALVADAEARVMRIAAGLFPGGYDANFAKIEAAIRETKP